MLPVAMMLWGCGAGDDLDPMLGDEAEDVGSSQAAITQFNKYAVGVIPLDPNACPADRRISVYTDDEDEDNESDSTGFEPPNTARRSRAHNTCRRGTSWSFCKVDGRDFFSWTRFSYKTEYFYAVLKLGTDCPNGAQGATHYSTGELHDNESSWTGPMGPNMFLRPNDGSADPNGPVLATAYCFFQDSPDKMTAFPDLGMQYAVFHDYDSVQPSYVLSKRWVYTDDDDDNITWSGNYSSQNFDALMDGNGNSMYDIARVQ